ncbi:MAG: hypothetical protein IH596_03880 [Bacteroidales bacterium]|nr:hypothetical protein [Bacteroidales bacterium]
MKDSTESVNKRAAIKGYLTSSSFIKPFLGIVIGAGIGFFAVNSPCARNKC